MYPDTEKFKQSFKLLLLKSCFMNSTHSNCETDSMSTLIDILNMDCDDDVNESKVSTTDASVPDAEPLPQLASGTSQSSVLLYVAGYVAFKYQKKHNCIGCRSLLLGSSEQYLPAATTLIASKAFDTDICDHGSLCMPSPSLFEFIEYCECVFQNNFKSLLHVQGICAKLSSAILRSADHSWFKSECSNVNKLVDIYISMRVKYTVKFINHKITSLPRGKRNLRSIILDRV